MSQADEDEALLPPDEEAALLGMLEAALRPAQLDPRVNARLIELALEDPLAEPSEEELIESARLRDALDQGTPHADASLLRALGAPFAVPGDGGESQRALQAALGSAATPASERPRSNVVYAVFGAASALLAAAAVALFISSTRSGAPAAAVAVRATEAGQYVVPHSTASLFAERFETGDTTARMDLIASVRGRDLRDNRYAAWGVR